MIKIFKWAALLLLSNSALAASSFDTWGTNSGSGNVVNAWNGSVDPSAGDTIVLLSQTSSGGGSPTITVADNIGGDTWVVTSVNDITGVGGSWRLSIAYLINCPSGITSITVTYNGGTPGSVGIMAAAYKLPSSAAYVGVSSINTQVNPGTTANAITANALSVGGSNAWAIGVTTPGTQFSTSITAGTGFTLRVSDYNSGWTVEDTNGDVTGSQTLTMTDATHGAAATYSTYALAFTDPSASCTHNFWSSTGAFSQPNGTTGSYWSISGAWATPNCTSGSYWRSDGTWHSN